MTKIRLFLSLLLIAVILAACAPASPAASPVPPAVVPSATAMPSLDMSTPSREVPTEALTPLPLATSRGPELHATDPTSVSLASGGLQLVEFFRFT